MTAQRLLLIYAYYLVSHFSSLLSRFQ